MRRASWKEVHGELTRLARSKGAYDADEARWLLEGKRVRVHEQLGYGSYLSYLEHVFGYGPRLASERLRVAEALASLPALFDALSSAELSWSAVRELSRVAVPATEAEWIAAARGRSVREVEEMVSGRRSGDRPGDPADPGAVRHVLRLELSADALAAFRDARRQIEIEVGHTLDDDEAVRMLAQYALGGPGDPGRAAYQIAITVCAECGRGARDGAGRVLAVEPHVVEAARCDAQELATHVGCESAPAVQSIPPRIRRLVSRRDHGRCRVPGCRAAKNLEIHHIIPRSAGGTHDPWNLMLTCSAHHTQIHTGVLRVSGKAPDRLEFRRRRDPSRPAEAVLSGAVGARAERHVRARADAHADAMLALRSLGATASQASRALAAASPGAVGVEALVREALAILWPTRASRVSEPVPPYGCWQIGGTATSAFPPGLSTARAH
ncbi:MAG TPA: HNH endonuclease signature motif containing protein [Kofleriaceae bacterium]|nr:HNH endonuclease signature motif containing protein [Kofleriaceae bacterium]